MNKLKLLINETDETKNVLLLSPNAVIKSLLDQKYAKVDTAIGDKGYDLVILDNQVAKSMDLRILWNVLNYSAVVYIDNVQLGKWDSENRNVNNMLKFKQKELIHSRQMTIPNVGIEKFLIVKCYPVEKKAQSEKIMQTKPLVVATVLKMGGIYNHIYVNNLASAVARHLTVPYEFWCLTDETPEKFNTNVHKTCKFAQGFPKWWGKVELFRRGQFTGRKVLYLDLDTLIINNIDFIASYAGSFCGLRDFYHMVSLGSGVMMWDGDDERVVDIYTDFVKNPNYVMNNYHSGDQQWINEKAKNHLSYIQDCFPKKIVSFKKDCWDNVTNVIKYPEDASIVCFHGPPRVHEIGGRKEIKEHWHD